MKVFGFDYIVICVDDVDCIFDFYELVFGMMWCVEWLGKWLFYFGVYKISV